MELTELIQHPERLDRNTLYELRKTLAVYPYFQTARLLMLQNLYILHDPSFDDELRRAAIYITDRRVVFKMIEAVHYRLAKPEPRHKERTVKPGEENRTISLIDDFLDTLPKSEANEAAPKGRKKRKPTPADAAVDYVAYILETQEDEESQPAPQLKGQSLIDDFINKDQGKIVLNDTPQFTPQLEANDADGKDGSEGIFTETLARIYIKQGRYDKALEIIRRLSLNYPKKNAYFADQIRFLEKLIINNNKKVK